MAAPGGCFWGDPKVKQGTGTTMSIEEGTKLFQQILKFQSESKQSKTATYLPVRGGLPPHLWKQQEYAHNLLNPFSSKSAAPGTPSYTLASGSNQPGQIVPKSQTIAVSQATSAPSTKPRPREENIHADKVTAPAPNSTLPDVIDHRESQPPSKVVPTNKSFQAPTYRNAALYLPVSGSFGLMHPALQKVLYQQHRLLTQKNQAAKSRLAAKKTELDNGAEHSSGPVRITERPINPGKANLDKKKWRPKHIEDWESQSLPSTIHSVAFERNTNEGCPPHQLQDTNEGVVVKDICAGIADELDIVVKGNSTGWGSKHAWKDNYSVPRSDLAKINSTEKGWLSQYCSKWIAHMPASPPPVAVCLDPEIEMHHKCDIDPTTGSLMSPISYPQTLINKRDFASRQELQRRMSSTAEIRVAKKTGQVQKSEAHKAEMEARRRKYCFEAQNVSSNWPANLQVAPVSLAARKLPGQTTTALARPPPLDPRRPRICCFLRPVRRGDLPQVLEIYNWEVENGRQAIDVRPLTLVDIERVFVECEAAGTPFIVAIKGAPTASVSRNEAPAAIGRRGNSRQHQRPGSSMARKRRALTDSPADKILGFGLISLPLTGLSGNVQTSVGRFIGRAQFYIEHQSRRHGIGRCILHKLLRCCSPFAPSADWYEWHDPHKSKACEEPGYNLRSYSRILVEMATCKDDPDAGWRQKLLDEMGFVYMATADSTRKASYKKKGGWYNNAIWQHDCSTNEDVREFD